MNIFLKDKYCSCVLAHSSSEMCGQKKDPDGPWSEYLPNLSMMMEEGQRRMAGSGNEMMGAPVIYEVTREGGWYMGHWGGREGRGGKSVRTGM